MMNIYNTLLPMVQNSVLPYLDSSDARVREEAASTVFVAFFPLHKLKLFRV